MLKICMYVLYVMYIMKIYSVFSLATLTSFCTKGEKCIQQLETVVNRVFDDYRFSPRNSYVCLYLNTLNLRLFYRQDRVAFSPFFEYFFTTFIPWLLSSVRDGPPYSLFEFV